MTTRRITTAIFLVIAVGAVLFFSSRVTTAQAVNGLQTDPSTPTPTAQTPVNPHQGSPDCLACHSNPKMVAQYQDGTTASLVFDPASHPQSDHTQRCSSCHTQQQSYPHEGTDQSSCSVCHWEKAGLPQEPDQLVFKLPYSDERALALEVSESCEKCHKENYSETADSVHLQIMKEGNRFAPVCVDCHNGHDVVPGSLSRESIPEVCSTCHLAVYTSYESSVHGEALANESNPDVPTCGDCHGIHNVHGPREAGFKADSIQTCGTCHSDAELMAKYGLSADVLNTYLDDFHGRTVDASIQSGGASTPAATCYDCHGIHNIRAVNDPLSTIYPENLQHTCQQCHKDAGLRFPQAWLSHYVPTWKSTPVLYLVIQIYRVFIPVTLIGVVLYIGTDAWRRFVRNRRNNSNETE